MKKKMDRNKISVVTGDPRSGTSLLMQTLLALGVPVAGLKYPVDAREEVGPRVEQAKQLNPLGFYEVPGVVMRGLVDIGEYGGKTLKIMAPGLMKTPETLVDRGVLCLRDPRWVAQSQTELQTNVQVLGVRGWESPTWRISPSRYVLEMGQFCGWWANRDKTYRDRFVTVDYDQHVDDPPKTIAAIAAHFGVKPIPLSIVNRSLRRSPASFIGWPREVQEEGLLSERIYAALKVSDLVECQACYEIQQVYRDKQSREHTMVYDPRLCCNVAIGGLRRIEANPELLAKLMESRAFRIRNGYTFDTSPDFGGETANEYMRRLPLDKGGDVPTKLVLYQGVEMTPEEAQAKHETRRRAGVINADPERVRKLLEGV